MVYTYKLKRINNFENNISYISLGVKSHFISFVEGFLFAVGWRQSCL